MLTDAQREAVKAVRGNQERVGLMTNDELLDEMQANPTSPWAKGELQRRAMHKRHVEEAEAAKNRARHELARLIASATLREPVDSLLYADAAIRSGLSQQRVEEVAGHLLSYRNVNLTHEALSTIAHRMLTHV